MLSTLSYIKRVLKLGSTPGYLLIGYYAIQSIFARGKLDAAAIDPTAVLFAAYSMLCLFYGVNYIYKHYKGQLKKIFNGPMLWFTLYTVFGGISALWSLQPALSAYRAVECFGMMIIMLATILRLARYNNINLILDWTAVYVFITILIRFIQYIINGAPIIPQIGYGGAFECAQMIATIFCFIAWFHVKRKFIKYTIIIFALFSMSTTGYIGMALGMLAYFKGNNKQKRIAYFGSVVILILCMYYGPMTLLKNTVFIERSEISIEKTSGRDQVWEMGFEWAKERPLHGYGFVAGETYLIRLGEGKTAVIGMHNTFMSALVGEGLIGLFLISMFWISMFVYVLSKKIPIHYRTLLISSFIASFIQSIANPGIGFRVYGSWMAAMYICILICVISKYPYNKNICKEKVLNRKFL